MTIGLTVIVLLILGFSALAFLLVRNKKNEKPDNSLLLLQNQINEMTRTLDSRLSESRRTLDSRLGESQKAMQSQYGETARLTRDVTERLVKLEETNRQVMTITDQLKNLQDVLKNPKQRGVLGEYYLEALLKNVFPPGSYEMQYLFKDGTIVDAIIRVKDKIIPIDSKFSLENYNRIVQERDDVERERLERLFKQDLKNRIDETSKYIKPSEGTMDFAFMFIPAEGVYYDLLVNQVGAVKTNTLDLIEYAFREKKVIIVSPTSFLAYLQTVMQGLRALQIEESAKEIRRGVEELMRHLKNYDIYFDKLGNQLGTAVNTYNTAGREFKKIDKDILKITQGKSIGVEPQLLAKPRIEDDELLDVGADNR